MHVSTDVSKSPVKTLKFWLSTSNFLEKKVKRKKSNLVTTYSYDLLSFCVAGCCETLSTSFEWKYGMNHYSNQYSPLVDVLRAEDVI